MCSRPLAGWQATQLARRRAASLGASTTSLTRPADSASAAPSRPRPAATTGSSGSRISARVARCAHSGALDSSHAVGMRSLASATRQSAASHRASPTGSTCPEELHTTGAPRERTASMTASPNCSMPPPSRGATVARTPPPDRASRRKDTKPFPTESAPGFGSLGCCTPRLTRTLADELPATLCAETVQDTEGGESAACAK
mmetsp:Transcript_42898/g.140898  ORF Transcript_42898/g.140898 Transcript_42898/m.140898 type:complete len:201 (-) Transcript_42898:1770-2372(-)